MTDGIRSGRAIADLAALATDGDGGDAGPHLHDGRYVQLDDARLTDPRPPTTHDHPHGHALDDLPASLSTDAETSSAITSALATHLQSDPHGTGVHDHDGDYQPLGSYATPADVDAAVADHLATDPHGTGGTGPHDHDGDYAAADDPRLTDARTPTAHGHTIADLPASLVDADELAAHAATPHGTQPHAHDYSQLPTDVATDGDVAAAVTGLVATTDPRLSDARTPTTHGHSAADLPTSMATDQEVADAIAAHLAAAPHEEPTAPGAVDGVVPVGGIILWSGSAASIPTGWQLCDGTNGTPDLRDRMIIGAATTGLIGSAGGTASPSSALPTHAAHSGVVSHTHPVTDPQHSHVQQTNNATTGGLSGWPARDTSTNTPSPTSYSTQPASTGISVDAPAGAVSELTHDAHPVVKYYALALIMRTA